MSNGLGLVFPPASISSPVHPNRDVIRRGQPSSATKQAWSGESEPSASATSERSSKSGRSKSRQEALDLKNRHEDRSMSKSAARIEKITKKLRVKGGHNPTGRQYKLTPTTPGSTGTNLGNPMVKQARWLMIQSILPFMRSCN
jgi:type IV secretory pathway VirB10-like protein